MTLSYDFGGDLQETLILPEQLFPPAHFKTGRRGEVALLYAVLEDAIFCLRKGKREKGRNYVRTAQEAEAWLFSDNDEWPFSFVNVCQHLGLDPAYLRRGLKRWRHLPRSEARRVPFVRLHC
jgi:hypothetical protein